ncbi:MAG: protein-disulfide reductase DsbD family protein [Acidobacteriota bacterium]|nr:protein-disulfide reductase DsbD family protein [Blastocatellia bacterium]MDW8413194.1 protein-disulfide reductase DsbD family protein [Acidobacteriota bacterium]
MLVLIVLLLSAVVIAAPVKTPHVEAELVSEVRTFTASEPFWVAVRLRMKPQWHTYWINPGDSGLATKVEWDLPEGFRIGELLWPVPEKIVSGPLVTFGYFGEVFLLAKIVPPDELIVGNYKFSAKVNWLVCREECIPESAELALVLKGTREFALPDPKWKRPLGEAKLRLPASLPNWSVTASVIDDELLLNFSTPSKVGNLEGLIFYCEQSGIIDYAAEQKVSLSQSGFQLRLKRSQYAASLPEEIRGVLYNPAGWGQAVVALSVRGKLIQQAYAATSSPTGFRPIQQITSVWLAVLLAFLGGLILNLMPCVLPVLSIKVLGFVRRAEDGKAWKHGLVFTLGVLVSFWLLAGLLLLLRSGGEQLGWGFQLQSPSFLICLSMFLFLLGLSLFGVFEIGLSLGRFQNTGYSGYTSSFLSGALATVVATPCTGPFMGSALGYALLQPALTTLVVFTALALGMATPYLLLCSFPSLLKYVPKSGPWMESFKKLMGFLMMGTVVWLVWVLGLQAGMNAVAMQLAAFVVASLGVWIYGRWASILNESRVRLAASALAGLLVFSSLLGVLFFVRRDDVDARSEIQWQEYSPALVAQLLAARQPVFIDFTAAWCLSCQVNERVTFTSQEVIDELRKRNVTMVKADWTLRDDTITRALAEFGRSGVPLYVLYSGIPGDSPKILPEVITPSILIEELKKLK